MKLPQEMRAITCLREGHAAESRPGPRREPMEGFARLIRTPLPRISEGQVLVRVTLAGAHHVDLDYLHGEYGRPRMPGHAAGLEGMGEVVDGIGPRAQALIGRRVAFLTSAVDGSWAEYAATEAELCLPLRPEISDEDAALLCLNPIGAAAMFELARASGAQAFVTTAGASQCARLLCSLAVAEEMSCISVLHDRQDVARLREAGAAEALWQGAPDFMEGYREALRRLRPRLLFDAVADQKALDMFVEMTREARWVIYGRLSPEAPRLSHLGHLVYLGKRIEGFWLARWLREAPTQTRGRVIAEVQARFADGRWRGEAVKVMSLQEAMEDLPEAINASEGRILLRP